MERARVTTNPRFAGQVERYHTWPVHRCQSIGEHTWQVMRIWWQLFGPMLPEVSTHILWHDAGELAVGDLPFPVKADNPELKRTMDGLETRAVAALGGPADHPRVSAGIRLRAKICDLLEMCEFGVHELSMGNQYAEPIVRDTFVAVMKLVEDLPHEEQVRVRAYITPKYTCATRRTR